MNLALINKLHEETEVVGKCWIWKGTKSDGYGYIRYNGTYWRLHRLSICLYTKQQYNGEWIACHICNTKLCWNPLHLYVGTTSTNTLDTVKAGTHYGGANHRAKDKCPKGHPYNLKDNAGKRRCTLCINEARKLAKERDKRLGIK